MSRFCVVEGTKITLNDKESIPIERIKVGQEILTFDLNTLQKSQKYDILVKMKTNKFGGIFQEDLVKNVWKNTVDEYYLINDKLKITKDHIVMAKRDQTYYWTKVENLLLNDYLFTELNIFERIESIIIVKEKVKVFNLEVNRVFNYFANSYLIHNGAPCSACLACGVSFYTVSDSAYSAVRASYSSGTFTYDAYVSYGSYSTQLLSNESLTDSCIFSFTPHQYFSSFTGLIPETENPVTNKSQWNKMYAIQLLSQYSWRIWDAGSIVARSDSNLGMSGFGSSGWSFNTGDIFTMEYSGNTLNVTLTDSNGNSVGVIDSLNVPSLLKLRAKSEININSSRNTPEIYFTDIVFKKPL